MKDIGRRLPLELQACTRVNRVMLINLCTETIAPVKNLTAVEGNASVYQVYPVTRITGEEGYYRCTSVVS